jgi:ATP/maltotriose-dependent transcriptional regulator MalT/DNA-binding SARP family transcriptional activator
MQVLLTTIGVPPVGEQVIPRPRLLKVLQNGLARKVLLIVAEAGFGKTTLMAQLAHALDWPVAWYTVAESGRDPGTFLASVTTALEAVRPGSTFTAQQLLGSLPDPVASWRTVADALINDLVRGAPDPMLLVLDDVHLLMDGPSASIPGYLAAYLPRHARLALLSRPPLSAPEITRLAGQGDVASVNARALSFTAEEVSDFLGGPGVAVLDQEALEEAHAQTEGWPVALSLLREVLREGGAGLEVAQQVGRTRRELYDYFATQVLGRLRPALQRFLLQISVLEPIEPDLAAAVTGTPEARRLLEDLEERGLLVALVDRDAGQYRLHVLLRETLRAHLEREEGPEEVRRLQRAVGKRLAEAGRPGQAIPYLLWSGDHPAAATLLEAHGERWVNDGLWKAVLDWIGALRREVIERSAPLLLLLGLVADLRGDWAEALRTYAEGAALAEGDRLGAAMAGQAKGLFRLQRYAEAKQTSETALRLEGLTDLTRARLLHRVATCQPWLGTPLEAVGLHAQALELFERAGDLQGQLNVLHDLVLLNQNLHTAPDWWEPLLPQVTDLYRRADSLMTRAEAALLMGELLLAKGEPQRALPFLEEAGQAARLLDHLHWLSNSYFFRGFALMDAGRLSESREVLLEGLRLVEERRSERYVRSLRLTLAYLNWKEGRLDETARALQENLDSHLRHKSLFFIPSIQINLAVVSADAGRNDEAQAHLLEARERLLTWGAERRAAECTLLLTGLSLRGGWSAEEGPLATALGSARRHRLDGMFIEHQRLLGPLVAQAIMEGEDVEYAGRLLAMLGDPALLAPALDHPDPSARLRAVEVLERMGGGETRTLLGHATRDPDPVVSARARAALAELSRRPPPTLEVRLLGGFEVRRGGMLLPTSAWQRRRDRLLFAYLLLATTPVSRDALLEALWPNLTPSSAATSLNVSWSRLKRTLEPALPEGIPSAYLTIEGTRYGLRRQVVKLDSEEFTKLVARAENALMTPGEQTRLLREALVAYRGDLLPDDVNEPWTIVDRERLRSLYLTLLQRLAEQEVEAGRPEEAVDHLRAVLGAEPWREEVYRRLMRLLAGLGRRSEALHLYRQCEALLRRDLGVDPSPETVALFQEIAAGPTP